MSRTAYVNGQFLPEENATVSIFDRGFLFGDGVYEVIPVINSRLLEKQHAMDRLERSLANLDMAWPESPQDVLAVLEELCRRNQLLEGYVYMQVTRGVADRDFAYPQNTRCTLVAYTRIKNIVANPLAETGVKVVSVPDLRWRRRDIKSVNLLAQCIAKQQAVSQGAYESWMLEGEVVTEGASSSAFIIKNGVIITRSLSNAILPGIRRKVIISMAKAHSLIIEERPFAIEEARAADEAFMSSATTLVLPIISIDGQAIGNGKPGPVTQKLRGMYIDALLQEARS